MAEAARGATDIGQRIGSIGRSVEQEARQLVQSAEAMNAETGALRQSVDRFQAAMRAA